MKKSAAGGGTKPVDRPVVGPWRWSDVGDIRYLVLLCMSYGTM